MYPPRPDAFTTLIIDEEYSPKVIGLELDVARLDVKLLDTTRIGFGVPHGMYPTV